MPVRGMALLLFAILVPLAWRQKRLVPVFQAVHEIQQMEWRRQAEYVLWLGPLFQGMYYSGVLTVIYVLPARLLERKRSTLYPFRDKGAFLANFSGSEVKRATLFTALSQSWLLLIFFIHFLGER